MGSEAEAERLVHKIISGWRESEKGRRLLGSHSKEGRKLVSEMLAEGRDAV